VDGCTRSCSPVGDSGDVAWVVGKLPANPLTLADIGGRGLAWPHMMIHDDEVEAIG
jgi:hypothetical protein